MPFISFLPHIGITVFDYAMSGGLTTGGTAPKSLTKTYAVSGGVTTNGSPLVIRIAVYVPTDGLTSGGTAPKSLTQTYAVSSGLTSGGAASKSLTHTYPVPAGGLTTSGTVPYSLTHTYTVSNGIVTSGTGTKSLTKTYPVSGGIVTDGTAPLIRLAVYIPSSGVETGGEAYTAYAVPGRVDLGGSGHPSFTHTYPVSGGLTSNGTASESLTKTYPVLGGLTTSGTAPLVIILTYTGSSGLVSNGTGLQSVTKTYVVSGGLTSGGTAPKSFTQTYAVSNGLNTSGTASESFTQAYGVSGGLTTGGVATTSSIAASGYVSSGGLLLGDSANTELSPITVSAPRGAGLIARSQLYKLIHDAYYPSRPPKRVFTYNSCGGLSLHGSSSVARRKAPAPELVPKRTYVSVPLRSGLILGTVSARTDLIPAVFKPLRTIYLVQGRGKITLGDGAGAEAGGVAVSIDGYPDIVQPFLQYWDPYPSIHGVKVYGEAIHMYIDRVQQIIEQEEEELLLGLLV